MNVLVTGSAGFIGQHVMRLLRVRGHEVRGVDAFLPQVHGHGEIAWPTETKYGRVRDVTPGADEIVVHLAAAVGVAQSQYEPGHYVDYNVNDTASLWQNIINERKVGMPRKVIVASSMSIYGEGRYYWSPEIIWDGGDGPVVTGRAVQCGWDKFHVESENEPTEPEWTLTDERKQPQPASVYAQTKYDTERYSLILGEAYDIPTIALRFFNTYGEGQALANPYTGVLMQFAMRVLNLQAPLVYEDGNQLRDFIHVSDIASAVAQCVEQDVPSGAYNVCTGIETSVGDLARLWCRIAHERGLPLLEPFVTHQFRSGDIRHCVGDPQKFHNATGWAATVTLEDGVRRVADWILDEYRHRVPKDRTAFATNELQEKGLIHVYD